LKIKLVLLFIIILSFCLSKSNAEPTNLSNFYPNSVYQGEYIIKEKSIVTYNNTFSNLNPLNLYNKSINKEFQNLKLHRNNRKNAKSVIVPLDFEVVQNNCDKLKLENPNIVNCEPNRVRYLHGTPNDPFFNQQWALKSSTKGINAEQAWDFTTGSKDIIIAVVDSGINYYHPELANSLWQNVNEIPQNGIDDDSNGVIDDFTGINSFFMNSEAIDCNGHGTHVAGSIVAQGNNNVGIAGVSWDTKILPIAITSDCSSEVSLWAAINAFRYIADLVEYKGVPIKVVNASFGTYDPSQEEFLELQRLRNLGVIVVASAGNENKNIDKEKTFPASYELDNIITVGSSSAKGKISSFSNFGENNVDILAPGEDILGLDTLKNDVAEQYATLSGTSMSAPLVSAVIALGYSINPTQTIEEVTTLLYSSVNKVKNLGKVVKSGGIINAYNFIKKLTGVEIDASCSNSYICIKANLSKYIPQSPYVTILNDILNVTIPDNESRISYKLKIYYKIKLPKIKRIIKKIRTIKLFREKQLNLSIPRGTISIGVSYRILKNFKNSIVQSRNSKITKIMNKS
jgi:subtilisin family serine protease